MTAEAVVHFGLVLRPPAAKPLGVKGLGGIGIVGVTAVIANAVYRATGQRLRDLPITLTSRSAREGPTRSVCPRHGSPLRLQPTGRLGFRQQKHHAPAGNVYRPIA